MGFANDMLKTQQTSGEKSQQNYTFYLGTKCYVCQEPNDGYFHQDDSPKLIETYPRRFVDVPATKGICTKYVHKGMTTYCKQLTNGCVTI